MDVQLGDILVMKKEHPCGEKRWLVLRTGMDFRLRCMGCGHEVMLPRQKAEKNIRQIVRESAPRDVKAKIQAKMDERAAVIPAGIATAFSRPERYTLSMTTGKGRSG